ncbi:MAG TPA: hypothetical protein VN205_11035 [Thermomonas sp.]|nr:hypothetical protein [Thermomonas sp.]
MSSSKKHSSSKLFPLTLAVAACIAAPATFAQSLGVNAGAAARVETPVASMQSQGNAHAGAHAMPQAATPAIPAVPATPAVPPVKADPVAGTEAQAAVPAVPATPATPATPAKKNWSELDANGNGSLSATEAAPMQNLAKVFVKADADANGELTQDEYKAWLAANAKGKAKAGG